MAQSIPEINPPAAAASDPVKLPWQTPTVVVLPIASTELSPGSGIDSALSETV